MDADCNSRARRLALLSTKSPTVRKLRPFSVVGRFITASAKLIDLETDERRVVDDEDEDNREDNNIDFRLKVGGVDIEKVEEVR